MQDTLRCCLEKQNAMWRHTLDDVRADTMARKKQVYKYRWAGRLCSSLTPHAWRDYKPLEARRIRLIYCLGEGVGKEFCCNKRALTWSPLKAYSVVLPPPPTLAVKDFMIPLLLSQPPQKASVTICKQVTSILILTSSEPWTTTSHIFGHLIWTELSVKGNSSHQNRWKKIKSISFSSYSLSNSSSYSSFPDSPSRLSSLAPYDSSVFTDSLMCR